MRFRVDRWASRSTNSCYLCAAVLTLAVSAKSLGQTIIYVGDSATGANNGTGWCDAYQDLQGALAAATSGREVHVAGGTYRPGLTGGPRQATFQLKSGVALRGGYVGGCDAPNAEQRSATSSLSGGNVYHVVTAATVDAGAILDGFQISGGQADAPAYPDDGGGGMLIVGGAPTVTDCWFLSNAASFGGAVRVVGGSLTTFTGCRFSVNSAGSGGAMRIEASHPVLSKCVFENNRADWAGAVDNIQTSHTYFDACQFSSNRATYNAGAIAINDQSVPTLVNTVMTANYAGNGGGALWILNGSDPKLVNLTIVKNSAGVQGGGVLNDHNGTNPKITNCILWENSVAGVSDQDAQIHVNSGHPEVSYSCIQGLPNAADSSHNLGGDPLFFDPDSYSVAGLRVRAYSPVIDAGDNGVLPQTVTADFAGQARRFDDPFTPDTGSGSSPIVDLGAFEFTIARSIHNITDDTFFPTIQAAVDAASEGDEIVVGPGWYFEHVVIDGTKHLILRSTSPDDPDTVTATIIDGAGNGNVIAVSGLSGIPIQLRGLTITNGAIGIQGSGSTADITHCEIVRNRVGCNWSSGGLTLNMSTVKNNGSSSGGGAMVCDHCSLLIQSCSIADNVARMEHGHPGVLTVANSVVAVQDSSIAGNFGFEADVLFCADTDISISRTAFATNGALYGGGIRCNGENLRISESELADNGVDDNTVSFYSSGGVLALEDTLIHGNRSYDALGGTGGVSIGQGTAAIKGCAFENNRSDFGTGPLVAWRDVTVTVEDCLFRNNNAFTYGGGGAIDCRGCMVEVRNTSIINNHASYGCGGIYEQDGDVFLSNCTLKSNSVRDLGGGAIACSGGRVVIQGSNITDNSFAYPDPDFGSEGIWSSGTELVVQDSTITGLGGSLARTSRFEFGPTGGLTIPAPEKTEIGGDITITNGGRIHVELGGELMLKEGAKMDLGPDGEVVVDGTLIAKDQASIAHTKLTVTRASFEGAPDISYNDVTFAEAGVPFGQFFVDGCATVQHNVIHADGDRYLDVLPELRKCGGLDPIADNQIYVRITEGVGNTRGGLFEARGQDRFCPSPEEKVCASGAFPRQDIPSFSEQTWTLEQLELADGAKVNLTNRRDYQYPFDNGGLDEVLYVKELVLGRNTVLNTAFQRMYYGSLTADDQSKIVDVPLLGFPLGLIAFDDSTPSPYNELDILVKARSRDPGDEQRCTCTGTCGAPDPTTCKEGSVALASNPISGTGGLMEMRTRAEDRESASSVVAKGTFAKAAPGEDVTVVFLYLFLSDGENHDAYLKVSLGDHPNIGDGNLVELARVYPPPAGRPGSAGSGRWAVLHGTFPAGGLSFLRGTYVELELVGRGAAVWIDKWDPVACGTQCGSFSGLEGVEGDLDYLYLLSEVGKRASGSAGNWCADSRFNGDGVIDEADLLGFDAYYDDLDGVLTLCGNGQPPSTAAPHPVTPVTDVPSDALLVAGKDTDIGDLP
jgi:hypothetical protein